MLLGILALAMHVGAIAAGSPTVAPITTVGPINPALVCLSGVQCIEDVKVAPHGQFADFSFKTTVSQLATVSVSTVAPKKQADGTYTYVNLPVDAFAIVPVASQHSAEMDQLQPGTLYHFLINAVK